MTPFNFIRSMKVKLTDRRSSPWARARDRSQGLHAGVTPLKRSQLDVHRNVHIEHINATYTWVAATASLLAASESLELPCVASTAQRPHDTVDCKDRGPAVATSLSHVCYFVISYCKYAILLFWASYSAVLKWGLCRLVSLRENEKQYKRSQDNWR